MARRIACGGTLLAAILFLGVGIGTLVQWNGLFSAGIALMLVLYAALLVLLARGAWRGHRGGGGLVASSLLHVLVAVSTGRGSHAPWAYGLAAVAVVTLAGALKMHVDELKARMG